MLSLYYLIAVNAMSLILFGLDKLFAINKSRRIPEIYLLSLCIIGGVFGGCAGMILFHHKISKPKFRYSVPFILILYVIALFVVTL